MDTLQTVSKAVAGFVVGGLVVYLARHNVVVSSNVNQALQVVIGAVIVGVGVYLAPKNKP